MRVEYCSLFTQTVQFLANLILKEHRDLAKLAIHNSHYNFHHTPHQIITAGHISNLSRATPCSNQVKYPYKDALFTFALVSHS